MLLCSLIEELCTEKENDKTGCNFNFGHECITKRFSIKSTRAVLLPNLDQVPRRREV